MLATLRDLTETRSMFASHQLKEDRKMSAKKVYINLSTTSELRSACKIAAAKRGITLNEYVNIVLKSATRGVK